MQTSEKRSRAIGIDDMAVYIPQLYLPIETLAQKRSIEYAKLNKGLGLEAMALSDTHEDAATMAANAILRLLQRNQINPGDIGRIYLGTESAVDGAKPMATYVQEMLVSFYSEAYGPDCMLHCDVVDLTFACIGSIDAMHNTLDWVRAGNDRMGIIVGADIAKYELDSTGEYTQGAGAVAVLVKEDPRLMTINSNWGIATRSVHDFFKPVRKVSKTDLIKEVLDLAGLGEVDPQTLFENLPDSLAVSGLLDDNEEVLTLHKETPVFDGPYSNDCYQERILEAIQHFGVLEESKQGDPITDNWRRLVFHLPYAYQARRMFSEIFFLEAKERGDWPVLQEAIGLDEPLEEAFESLEEYQKAYAKFLRAVTKTKRYQTFVTEKIEKGERASSLIGNLYTSSLFLALMSTLEADLEEHTKLEGSHIGFFGYGSGSKSKVFEGTVQEDWKFITERFQLKKRLAGRQAIDYDTYEALHRGQLQENIAPQTGTFYLKEVCSEKGVKEGARSYHWSKNRVAKLIS